MNKVYIELVFLDNFIINGLIIWLASVLTKSRKKWGRYAIAAALGSVYACIAAVFGGVLTSLPVKTIVAFAMCTIAFYTHGLKSLLRNTCAFYAAAFVLAGAIYAAAFSGGNTSFSPLLRYIMIGIGMAAVLIGVLSHIRQRLLLREKHTVRLRLTYGQRSTVVQAYIDTGNLVTAPISGIGVVFMTKAVASALLDKQALALISGDTTGSTDRLRIIAAATACGSGIFYGIEIDDIALAKAPSGTRAVVCIAKTALAEGSDAIVGPAIMDKLLKGAHHDDTPDTNDCGMGRPASANRAENSVHQRQRGASATADPAGGSSLSSGSG